MQSDLETNVEGDKEKAIEALRSECICPGCPIYNKCAKEAGELLYCFLGRSQGCITNEDLGCICLMGCPVAKRAGLDNLFYCTKGTEAEIRKAPPG
ncbi:MAG: hypothetical protein A4E30_00609 [Methanomassiliicoccales archaeon PtaB.Bin215]|nr:MAG: hypothetical protein A4E30_00609 [Methanomassiliicoccales archaeon PtaB.Bin215]